MTTLTIQERAAEIFADARQMHAQAIERLEASDIRDAAEKAWCATKRATDAMILAKTGTEVEFSTDTRRGLIELAKQGRAFSALRTRYYARQNILHGDCFYLGMCDPIDDTQRRIRETVGYIDDAERLAF
ncbi:MAG: hypothetical protein OXI54_12380 [Chloroflexota bacterium]|nr:hypothetical protein [Chloroflexota bacterium]MDE2684929.1 hypothetical protein [Chloroflexota bacterium]